MIKLEYQQNVWDETQKKLVSIISITDGERSVAFDGRALKGKYAVLEAVAAALQALERK